MKKCCGTCKWNEYDEYGYAWVCCNGDSDYCADFIEYEHSCEEWEEKNGEINGRES